MLREQRPGTWRIEIAFPGKVTAENTFSVVASR
jgi:hypothetical protein